jgi:hypothetical protein
MQRLLAYISRLFGVPSEAAHQGLDEQQRQSLPANFGAIVLNGLFFPTAGKILGAGLLLAWFMDDLRASTFLIGLLVPIQYGIGLLAQPWIGQWMSGKPLRVPYYRNQALLRGTLWLALPTLLLAAGGAIVDWFGFPPVFIAIALCGAAAAALSLALPKPGSRTSSTSPPRQNGRKSTRGDC